MPAVLLSSQEAASAILLRDVLDGVPQQATPRERVLRRKAPQASGSGPISIDSTSGSGPVRCEEVGDVDVQRLRELDDGHQRRTPLPTQNLREVALGEVRFEIEAIQRTVLLSHQFPQPLPKLRLRPHTAARSRFGL